MSTRETVKTIGASSDIRPSATSRGFGPSSDFQSRFDKLGFGGNTSPSQPQSKPAQKPAEFIDDAVKTHNEYRRKHGVCDIKHNSALSKIAQGWADHLASSGSFQHSTNVYKGDKLGENIATKWSSSGADYTGKEAVDQWYSEVSKYDFRRATFASGTGHFTQVVWKGSHELGIGKAKGKDGRVFVVANYYPAGNIMGHFAENVHPCK